MAIGLFRSVDSESVLWCILESLMTKFIKPTFGTCGEGGGGDETRVLIFHEFRFILLFFSYTGMICGADGSSSIASDTTATSSTRRSLIGRNGWFARREKA